MNLDKKAEMKHWERTTSQLSPVIHIQLDVFLLILLRHGNVPPILLQLVNLQHTEAIILNTEGGVDDVRDAVLQHPLEGGEEVGNCCNRVWKSIIPEWSWISSVVEDKDSPLSTSLIIPLIPPFKLEVASSFDIVDIEQSKFV